MYLFKPRLSTKRQNLFFKYIIEFKSRDARSGVFLSKQNHFMQHFSTNAHILDFFLRLKPYHAPALSKLLCGLLLLTDIHQFHAAPQPVCKTQSVDPCLCEKPSVDA